MSYAKFAVIMSLYLIGTIAGSWLALAKWGVFVAIPVAALLFGAGHYFISRVRPFLRD